MTNAVIGSLNEMTIALNSPIGAITTIGTRFYSLASIAKTVFSLIKGEVVLATSQTKVIGEAAVADRVAQGQREVAEHRAAESQMTADTQQGEQDRTNLVTTGVTNRGNARRGAGTPMKGTQLAALGLNIGSIAFSAVAANLKNKNDEESQRRGGLLSAASTGMSAAAMLAPLGPVAMVAGGAIGTLIGVFNNLNLIVPDTATRLRNATKAAEEANNAMLMQRNSSKSLQSAVQNLQKLSDAQYDSVEAQQAYLEASNALADQYPELIQYYDETGNAIVDLTAANNLLAISLQQTTQKTIEAASANYQRAEAQVKVDEEQAFNDQVFHTKTEQGQFLLDILAEDALFDENGIRQSYGEQLKTVKERGSMGAMDSYWDTLIQGLEADTDSFSQESIEELSHYANIDLSDVQQELLAQFINGTLDKNYLTSIINSTHASVTDEDKAFAQLILDTTRDLEAYEGMGTQSIEKMQTVIRAGITSVLNASHELYGKDITKEFDDIAGAYEALQELAISNFHGTTKDQFDEYIKGLDFNELSQQFIDKYNSLTLDAQTAYNSLMSQRDQVSASYFKQQLM